MYFLHFIWLSKNRCPWEIINTWKPTQEDNYQIIVWRDNVEDESRETDIKELGNFPNKSLMDESIKFNQKSDILRLEILHRFGGIYMDCDIVRFSKLCPMELFSKRKNKYGFYISWEKKGCISNSCICVPEKNNTIINYLIKKLKGVELKDDSGWKSVCDTTGPRYITNKLNELKYPFSLVKPYYYVNFGIDFSKQFINSSFKITRSMNETSNKDIQYYFNSEEILGIQLWFGGKKITYNSLTQKSINNAYKNINLYVNHLQKLKPKHP